LINIFFSCLVVKGKYNLECVVIKPPLNIVWPSGSWGGCRPRLPHHRTVRSVCGGSRGTRKSAMLFNEADQTQGPQRRGRHSLGHVTGLGIPPGPAVVVDRGRTARASSRPRMASALRRVRGRFGLRVFWPPCPPVGRLSCGSCSSDQGFASSFLPTLPRGSAIAVRLGVPVTKAPRGLSPPSHFPVRFRSPVDSAGPDAARRARRTQKKRGAKSAPLFL